MLAGVKETRVSQAVSCSTLVKVVRLSLLPLESWCQNFCVFSFVYSKARTLFEKNAAPILHLSGMDVTVVKVRILHSVDFI